jgi:hypothetical protein
MKLRRERTLLALKTRNAPTATSTSLHPLSDDTLTSISSRKDQTAYTTSRRSGDSEEA